MLFKHCFVVVFFLPIVVSISSSLILDDDDYKEAFEQQKSPIFVTFTTTSSPVDYNHPDYSLFNSEENNGKTNFNYNP